jgi:hypothetical protein
MEAGMAPTVATVEPAVLAAVVDIKVMVAPGPMVKATLAVRVTAVLTLVAAAAALAGADPIT